MMLTANKVGMCLIMFKNIDVNNFIDVRRVR